MSSLTLIVSKYYTTLDFSNSCLLVFIRFITKRPIQNVQGFNVNNSFAFVPNSYSRFSQIAVLKKLWLTKVKSMHGLTSREHGSSDITAHLYVKS